MIVVYVSGPITAETEVEYFDNIDRAEQYSLELWKRGYAVVCPHSLSLTPGARSITWSEWMGGDLEIMQRCDAVFALPGWYKSPGALLEIRVAKDEDIPVFTTFHDMDEYYGVAK